MNNLEDNVYLNPNGKMNLKSTKLSQKIALNIKKTLDGSDEMLFSCFVIQKIKELNPMVEIREGIYNTIIFSSVSVEDLVLPDGFYYSEINGITNKYVTDSENYISIRVYPLAYYDSSFM